MMNSVKETLAWLAEGIAYEIDAEKDDGREYVLCATDGLQYKQLSARKWLCNDGGVVRGSLRTVLREWVIGDEELKKIAIKGYSGILDGIAIYTRIATW